MTISHILESFDGLKGGSFAAISEDSLEEQKLEAFEKGYKAGWDDAAAAQSNEKGRVASDFARNLQDLSFTYHEAFSHVINAIKPLLTQISDAVLPEIARKTFGLKISEQLRELAETAGKQDVEIVVSPNNSTALKGMLTEEFDMPISVVEEASLGEGQAYLRLGQSECQVNNDEVMAGVNEAIEAFFHEIEKEAANG